MEFEFCRRCGTVLAHVTGNVFKCTNGHIIFRNSSPAVVLILIDEQKRPLVAERAIDPGKGKLHVSAGFCTDTETIEEAMARELKEELNLLPRNYGKPQYFMSHVEPYEYKGEVIPVLNMIYWAPIQSTLPIKARDDLKNASFKAFTELNLADFQYHAVARALTQLHEDGLI